MRKRRPPRRCDGTPPPSTEISGFLENDYNVGVYKSKNKNEIYGADSIEELEQEKRINVNANTEKTIKKRFKLTLFSNTQSPKNNLPFKCIML